jgi:hypothetical protein
MGQPRRLTSSMLAPSMVPETGQERHVHGQAARGRGQANQEAVADAWGIGICAVKKVWDEKYAPHPNSFAARGPIIEKVY